MGVELNCLNLMNLTISLVINLNCPRRKKLVASFQLLLEQVYGCRNSPSLPLAPFIQLPAQVSLQGNQR